MIRMGRLPRRAWHRVAGPLFHLVCFKDVPPTPDVEEMLTTGFSSTERFFARFPQTLDLSGKTVLDYGCGAGSTSVWAAQRGARRVLGVDVANVDEPHTLIRREFPDLASVVELRQISTPADIGDEKFDVVISKNTFEHVADPHEYVRGMVSHLSPTGRIIVGFSPLWKSPTGGHIDFMTKLPWAHLLFPQDVIMRERRRFRPAEDATRFAEIRGGLNKMTLARFRAVMENAGLEHEYLRINAGRHARSAPRSALLAIFKLLAAVPPLREYFSFSVHSIWRHAASSA